MSKLITLTTNDTTAVHSLGSRGPGTYYEDLWAQDNAILSSVYVDDLEQGASITVTFIDVGLSAKPQDEVDLVTHGTITAAGSVSKKNVSGFHNQPRVKTVISGGYVSYGHWVTLKSESLQAVATGGGTSASEPGDTTVYTGITSANVVTVVPEVAANRILNMSVSVTIDQPFAVRLQVSIDGMANWIRLAPGDSFSIAPKGEIKQIYLDGGNAQVGYEIVLQTLV